MFNSDCLERVARAFVTGCVAAFASLHIFANGSFDVTELEQAWKPILVGGLGAVFTLVKAQWGIGRGDDPDTGSWKGIAEKGDGTAS